MPINDPDPPERGLTHVDASSHYVPSCSACRPPQSRGFFFPEDEGRCAPRQRWVEALPATRRPWGRHVVQASRRQTIERARYRVGWRSGRLLQREGRELVDDHAANWRGRRPPRCSRGRVSMKTPANGSSRCHERWSIDSDVRSTALR